MKKYRIKIIVPISTHLYNNEVYQSAMKVAAPDLEIVVENIQKGSSHIQGRYELIQNAPHVLKIICESEEQGFDGIFVSDFDMCGVEEAREIVDIPVIGGFFPSASIAMSLADKFSIITILNSVVDLQSAHTRHAGFSSRLASVHSIGLEVNQLSRKEAVIAGIVKKSMIAASKHGASAIILGCTGFLNVAEEAQKILNHKKIPIIIIDPTHAAVSFLYAIIRNGKSHSRITYEKTEVLL